MSQANKGRLFLIPNVLGEGTADAVIGHQIRELIENLDMYLVENVRTARRYLRDLGIQRPIEELHFSVLDKKTRPDAVNELIAPLKHGVDMGVMSEAGAPGVADPGARAVAAAHKMGATVVPLVGPSSFLLALMSSGFNGQSFTFHGYLPIQKNDRQQAISRLERDMQRNGQTQMFMETPFRNDQLLEDILSVGKSETLLCIASDLTTDQEFIRTMPIHKWRKQRPKLHKRPTVFLIGR